MKRWLVAAAIAVSSPGAPYAAGLGKLIVHSTLGQPLNAEVELLSVQKGETITARLASPEVYQQAGAQYNNVLTGTRVTVERRPNGEPYLRATTPRPVNEPFLNLLIEINSENGRVVRQYTALLDPPGYGRATVEIPPAPARTPEAAAPANAPPPAPSPAAATPVAPPTPPIAEAPLATPQPAPRAPARSAAPAPSTGAGQYGPVKPGETLRKIARNVKPEGVSLEQTLVGLYRQNPDAFINKNMNLVKSGKILRVPEANELAALTPGDAAQEVRLQVADFNSYRNRLADRPNTAPEEGSVRSGRIGSARVTDRGAAEGPRDTVRISRGEPAAKSKAGMNTAERLRALEEEVIARDRALAEANERIGQLEQIIKDTQRAIELKGGGTVTPQKGADKGGPAAQPGSPIAVAPPVPQTEKSQEPPSAKGAPPEPPATAAKAEPPKTEAAPAAKADTPKAKEKATPPSEPAKERSLVATLFDEPLYLAAGGAVILLGGLGFMMARRRRQAALDADEGEELADFDEPTRIAPTLGAPEPAADSTRGSTLIERAAARNDSNTTAVHEPVEPLPLPAATTAPALSASAATPTTAPAAAAVARTRSSSDDNDLDFDLMKRGGSAAAGGLVRRDDVRAALSETPPAAQDDDPPAQPNEFNLEPLPPVNAPMEMEKVSSEPPANVDFKLDLNDLDVNARTRDATEAGRDDHWHDVQQKFDLAKAYEEMGDKGGARDILQEVLREGDEEQQAQARKRLESLI